MAVLTEVVEGWSDDLPFTLKADGVAIDLTSLTVTGVLHDRRGTAVSTTDKVAVSGTTSGEVTYTPASSDLKASGSPYYLRFKVVDASTQIVYFANGAADTLVVHEE